MLPVRGHEDRRVSVLSLSCFASHIHEAHFRYQAMDSLCSCTVLVADCACLARSSTRNFVERTSRGYHRQRQRIFNARRRRRRRQREQRLGRRKSGLGTAQNVDENENLPRRRRRLRERVDGPRHIQANSGGLFSSLSDQELETRGARAASNRGLHKILTDVQASELPMPKRGHIIRR